MVKRMHHNRLSRLKEIRVNSKQRSVRKELVAIAGNPSFVCYPLRGVGNRVSLHFWWVPLRGKRKGEKQHLMVMADRAQDLGCKIMWSIRQTGMRYRDLRGGKYPEIPMQDANMVIVWIEG